MKKALGVTMLMVTVIGLSLVVAANSAWVGDLVLQDKRIGCCPLPGLSISRSLSDADTFCVSVTRLCCANEAWLYLIVDGNLVIDVKKIHCGGCYALTVPSRYNQGHLRFGCQTVTVVLSTTKLFDLPGRYGLVGQSNFLGYACCDAIAVRQATFMTRACCQSCCCCMGCCCP